MLSFEELIFINKAKVMFKVTHGLSPIYITEMFQIKGSTNDDTMTLRSDSNTIFKTPKPKLNMFENLFGRLNLDSNTPRLYSQW